MAELDDARTLVPLAAVDLTAEDLIPVFHAASNTVRKTPARDLQVVSAANVLNALGDGSTRIYSGYIQDALATPITISMQTGEAEANQFDVTEIASRAGTIDSVNMNSIYEGPDETVTSIGYVGEGTDALIVGLATKSQMVVTGDITGDSAVPLTCPNLLATDEVYERPNGFSRVFRDPSEQGNYCIGSAANGWEFQVYDATFTYKWASTAAVATPDLVPAGAYDPDTNPDAWQPQGDAGGEPVFTPALPTANQVVDAINASGYALAMLVGDGTGTVTDAEEVNGIRRVPVFVDSYANETAAGTGGVEPLGLYFNEFTGQFMVRPAGA